MVKKTTKKFLISVLAVILSIVLLVGCGGGSANNASNSDSSEGDAYPTPENPITFSLGHCTPEGSLADLNVKVFKKHVEEMSNGAILIDMYPNSQLGTEPTMMDSVYAGTLDMAAVSTTVLTTVIDELNALLLPFLFDDLEALGKVVNSEEFYEKTSEIVTSSTGMHFIGVPIFSARGLLNTKHPVTKPEDMKDLTIRIIPGNIIVDIFNAMNVSTTQLAFGEVYTGMQQGVIDGVENGIPDCIEMKFVEVGKYYTNTLQCINTMPIIMSDAAWNKISPEQQQIIRNAAKEAEAMVVDATNEAIEKAYEQAEKEYGIEITLLNDEQRAAFKAACQSVYDKYIPIIGEDYYNFITSLVE